MAGHRKWPYIAFSLLLLLVALLTFLWVVWRSSNISQDIGSRCVRLLYQFSTPQEIVDNQRQLELLVTDEVFSDLNIDDTNRVVNAYYKFKYSTSSVNIVSSAPGCVVYTIANENIDPDSLWIFKYTLDSSGKIDWVKEYSVLDIRSGGVIP